MNHFKRFLGQLLAIYAIKYILRIIELDNFNIDVYNTIKNQ